MEGWKYALLSMCILFIVVLALVLYWENRGERAKRHEAQVRLMAKSDLKAWGRIPKR